MTYLPFHTLVNAGSNLPTSDCTGLCWWTYLPFHTPVSVGGLTYLCNNWSVINMTYLPLHTPGNVGYDSPPSTYTSQCWLWLPSIYMHQSMLVMTHLVLHALVSVGYDISVMVRIYICAHQSMMSWHSFSCTHWSVLVMTYQLSLSRYWLILVMTYQLSLSRHWLILVMTYQLSLSRHWLIWSWPTNYPSPIIGWSWAQPTRLSFSRHWTILAMTFPSSSSALSPQFLLKAVATRSSSVFLWRSFIVRSPLIEMKKIG